MKQGTKQLIHHSGVFYPDLICQEMLAKYVLFVFKALFHVLTHLLQEEVDLIKGHTVTITTTCFLLNYKLYECIHYISLLFMHVIKLQTVMCMLKIRPFFNIFLFRLSHYLWWVVQIKDSLMLKLALGRLS